MKKYSKQIVITGTLLIWFIKFIVRPYIIFPESLSLLIGVAPNLLGCFLLPFGTCWFLNDFLDMENTNSIRLACISTLILVIINEYLQLIPIFGRTFDYFDILASFAGVFAGYKTFLFMLKKTVPGFSNA